MSSNKWEIEEQAWSTETGSYYCRIWRFIRPIYYWRVSEKSGVIGAKNGTAVTLAEAKAAVRKAVAELRRKAGES